MTELILEEHAASFQAPSVKIDGLDSGVSTVRFEDVALIRAAEAEITDEMIQAMRESTQSPDDDYPWPPQD